ncbi:MAG: hypothetical protein J4F28_08515 [Nitrosopumilaceae archaeon]|nr:hypothetical protein [Nitrosopumilaceae archaeon]
MVTCKTCGRECEEYGELCKGGCGQIIKDTIECPKCGNGYVVDRSDGCECKK